MTELKITQADEEAAKRHQQRFVTDGRSETELLWEAFARHRIAAEEGKAELVEALQLWLAYDQGTEVSGVELMLNYDKALAATKAALARVRGEG